MTIRRYAEGTEVPVEKTLAEMRTLLAKHGATHFAYGESPKGTSGIELKQSYYRQAVRNLETLLGQDYEEQSWLDAAAAMESDEVTVA